MNLKPKTVGDDVRSRPKRGRPPVTPRHRPPGRGLDGRHFRRGKPTGSHAWVPELKIINLGSALLFSLLLFGCVSSRIPQPPSPAAISTVKSQISNSTAAAAAPATVHATLLWTGGTSPAGYYSVQCSADLQTWTEALRVPPTNTSYSCTVTSGPAMFWRVAACPPP